MQSGAIPGTTATLPCGPCSTETSEAETSTGIATLCNCNENHHHHHDRFGSSGWLLLLEEAPTENAVKYRIMGSKRKQGCFRTRAESVNIRA